MVALGCSQIPLKVPLKHSPLYPIVFSLLSLFVIGLTSLPVHLESRVGKCAKIQFILSIAK